jgi:hypothetical protein
VNLLNPDALRATGNKPKTKALATDANGFKRINTKFLFVSYPFKSVFIRGQSLLFARLPQKPEKHTAHPEIVTTPTVCSKI